MKLNWTTIALAAGAALALYLVARKVGKGVAAVATAVNPTSDKNIFYSGVNAIGSAITGADSGKDDTFSLGASLYNAKDAIVGLFTGNSDNAKIEEPVEVVQRMKTQDGGYTRPS